MVRHSHNAAGVKKSRTAPGCRRSSKCRSTYACRKMVYNSKDPSLRAGRLHSRQLTKNRVGKVVSKKKSFDERRKYRTDPNHPLRMRNDIVKEVLSRRDFDSDGFSFDGYDGYDNDEGDGGYDDGGYEEYSPGPPTPAARPGPPTPAARPPAASPIASPNASQRPRRISKKPARFKDYQL